MREIAFRGGVATNENGSFSVVIEIDGLTRDEAQAIVREAHEPVREAVINVTAKRGPFRIESLTRK